MNFIERARALFDLCLEQPEAERERLITAECRDDAELADQVRRLLRIHAESESVSDDGWLRLAGGHPKHIGPFRVLRKLGEGGMGVVYLAEQGAPARRQVAVKLLRPGLVTQEVLARFDAERRVLALMTHPNIAGIIDAGTAEHGRPYLAMEYVSGVPLTRYCEERRLGVHERLRLFVRACHGVQHAHQRGVIHRDLKPSNILVMEGDAGAVPKVIDFGIAKMVSDSDTPAYTRAGQLIGTPDYMSPEQLTTTAGEVDTRADVYALGVVLYELLCGATPFDLRDKSLHDWQIQDLVRDGEPSAPSARVRAGTTLDGEEWSVPPRVLRRTLAGELDWIALKAIARRPDERYASPADLAGDIERYLAGEAVVAGPRSRTYLLRKFLSRHAVASGVTAGLFAALCAATGYTLWQTHLLRVERDRTAREAERAHEVTDFVIDMFAIGDPQTGYGRDLKMRDAVDIGVRRIQSELARQPEVQAVLFGKAGEVYRSLGLYERSIKSLERARDLQAVLYGADDERGARTLRDLAKALHDADRYADAARAYREAIDIFAARRGAHDAETLTTQIELGLTLLVAGDAAAAERIFGGVQPAATPDHALVRGRLAYGRGRVELRLGRIPAAVALMREALATLDRELPVSSTETTGVRNYLVYALSLQGELAEAEALSRRGVEALTGVYGENHIDVAITYNTLAMTLQSAGKYPEAEAEYLRALKITSVIEGDHSLNVATLLNNLAGLYFERGRKDEALRLFEQTYEVRRQALGDAHEDTVDALVNYGSSLVLMQRYQEALTVLVRARDAYARLFGAEHWKTAVAQQSLGEAHTALRRYAEAERLLQPAYEVLRRQIGPDQALTRNARQALVDLYRAWGKPQRATALGADQ